MSKNATIKKLDRQEIADLGLYSQGIYTYKGQVKSRVKGLKTTFRTADEVHFEREHVRWEVVQIVTTNDEGKNDYAIRCFDKDRNEYENFWAVLAGLKFIK